MKYMKQICKFSVVIHITNIYNKNLISNSISIQTISMYEKEKEHVFLPFSFYYVRDVKIDIKNIQQIFI